jgi:hypothetical protein
LFPFGVARRPKIINSDSNVEFKDKTPYEIKALVDGSSCYIFEEGPILRDALLRSETEVRVVSSPILKEVNSHGPKEQTMTPSEIIELTGYDEERVQEEYEQRCPRSEVMTAERVDLDSKDYEVVSLFEIVWFLAYKLNIHVSVKLWTAAHQRTELTLSLWYLPLDNAIITNSDTPYRAMDTPCPKRKSSLLTSNALQIACLKDLHSTQSCLCSTSGLSTQKVLNRALA